jgi:hypothetical protein
MAAIAENHRGDIIFFEVERQTHDTVGKGE